MAGGSKLKGAGMLEILEIDDPYERLLYGIVYQAFLDFYYHRYNMSLRLPAFTFLVSGGGVWKQYLRTNIKRDFIRYCKWEYWK